MPGLPRRYVSPPPFTPAPYGLFSVAQLVTDADVHWMNGVTFEPLCGTVNAVANPCLSPVVSGGTTKVETSDRTIRGADPFTIYERIDCGVVGNYDRVEQDTLTMLERGAQRKVEETFWTGSVQGATGLIRPHLAANTEIIDGSEMMQTSATVITGVALDVVEGIGRLEDTFADCYDGVGVIHASQVIVEAMAAQGLLLVVPNGPNGRPALRTYNGNWVVAGAGYPGTSPAGAVTAGGHWVYMTGSVFYFRSAPKSISRPSEAVVRSINDLVYIAEQTYVVAWDCCHLAVLISTGGIVAGGTNSPS